MKHPHSQQLSFNHEPLGAIVHALLQCRSRKPAWALRPTEAWSHNLASEEAQHHPAAIQEFMQHQAKASPDGRQYQALLADGSLLDTGLTTAALALTPEDTVEVRWC